MEIKRKKKFKEKKTSNVNCVSINKKKQTEIEQNDVVILMIIYGVI